MRLPPHAMILAFFHDHPFTRDAAGVHHGSGSVPYEALARYLAHFERVVVVGRVGPPDGRARTVASGPGVEFACLTRAALAPARYVPAVTRHVRAVLARVDCAVVRLPAVLGPIACREALRAGTPLLVEVVGDVLQSMWHHGSWKGKALALPLHLLQRRCVARAPFALYVTREALQRRYPAPRALTASASDVLVDRPRADVLERRLARIARGGPGAPATLGLVGSYDVRYKGHETALRALGRLRRAGRDVSLRCIGLGDPSRWRARAAELGVAGAVELGGTVPHGGPVLDWLDAIDVCVVPSLTEGLPRTIVEAMSRAVPVVGSRTGGIPELLDARCLHRPGDPEGLARAIAALLDDPAALAAEARRGWQVAAAFSEEVLGARRSELLSALRAAGEARARAGLGPPRAAAGPEPGPDRARARSR